MSEPYKACLPKEVFEDAEGEDWFAISLAKSNEDRERGDRVFLYMHAKNFDALWDKYNSFIRTRERNKNGVVYGRRVNVKLSPYYVCKYCGSCDLDAKGVCTKCGAENIDE